MKIFPGIGILILLKSFLLISCTKSETPDQQPTTPSVTDSLRISTSILNEKGEGQKDSVIVQSSVSWTLSIPLTANWITADSTSGAAGTKKIRFTIAPNPTIHPRSATVTVSSSDTTISPQTITIRQDQPPVKIIAHTFNGPGGATIDIVGTGFAASAADNSVTINSVSTPVTSVSVTPFNTTLRVTIPSKLGSGKIIVRVNTKADTSLGEFRYDWVGVTNVMAGGVGGYADGMGVAAKFFHPAGLDIDANGNLYVADYANYKVRKIAPSGMVTTMPGRFLSWTNPMPGVYTDFGLVQDVAVDASGNVFVVGANSNSVDKISTDGTVTLLTGGSASGYADGPAASALYWQPTGIAVTPAGDIIIADMKNHRIRKLSASTVSTVAGSIQSYADGTGSAARFNMPFSVAVDASGNYIVSDYYNGRIRKVTPGGVVTTMAGGGYGSADGDALTAGISNPTDLAIDSQGNIFVCDGNSVIRWITPAGKVRTITPTISLSGPQGIAVDASGTLYVSDYYNNRICKIIIQ